jgi:hypothetical protein
MNGIELQRRYNSTKQSYKVQGGVVTNEQHYKYAYGDKKKSEED